MASHTEDSDGWMDMSLEPGYEFAEWAQRMRHEYYLQPEDATVRRERIAARYSDVTGRAIEKDIEVTTYDCEPVFDDNYCLDCGESMGSINPRQLCGKVICRNYGFPVPLAMPLCSSDATF